MSNVLSGCAVRAEIQKSDAELVRLREIEHRVWHLLDDSEQRDDEIVCMRGDDYEELCKLLPEDHPHTIPPAAQPQEPGTQEDGYYRQDSRSMVGNDMLWWKRGGGYTTNLDEAEIFAEGAISTRDTDIAWPVAYIRSKSRPAVDFQYVSRSDAAAGDGGK